MALKSDKPEFVAFSNLWTCPNFLPAKVLLNLLKLPPTILKIYLIENSILTNLATSLTSKSAPNGNIFASSLSLGYFPTIPMLISLSGHSRKPIGVETVRQGSCSAAFRKFPDELNVVQSFAIGCPFDNVVLEAFFKFLKAEDRVHWRFLQCQASSFCRPFSFS